MMSRFASVHAITANVNFWAPSVPDRLRDAADAVIRRGLVYAPDPRLKVKAAPVAEITDHVRVLAYAMDRLMRDAEGVGLAAPQIGESVRMFVAAPAHDRTRTFLNPEIVEQNGRYKTREGCLSIPGVHRAVKRARTVRVRWMTLGGETVEETLSGQLAVIAQHEIDHLNGVLMTDRSKHAW